MAIRSGFNQRSDYFYPGSPNDSRLFHSDPSDQVQVWSPNIGRGYFQKIQLRDDLELLILDYRLHDTLTINFPGQNKCVEFEFQLAGPEAKRSVCIPDFGLRSSSIRSAQWRRLKIVVIFRGPVSETYCQAMFERFSPQVQKLTLESLQSLLRGQLSCNTASFQAMVSQLLNGGIRLPQSLTAEQLWPEPEFLGFDNLLRRSMTAEMYPVIHHILSCPYSGRIRRIYLERKVLKLVSLHLNLFEQLRSPSYPIMPGDLDGIYEAGEILARQLYNPPSVDVLSRQVGLNRLKLNYGFHHVYGATPFRYLRDCRLLQAQQLFMTSELGVREVADKVGYNSRSSFTTAFQQKFGLSPKTFRLHRRNYLGRQRYAS